MRKVLGAQRTSLIFQFLGESVLFSFLSLIIALLLVKLLLPVFMVITQTELGLNLFHDLTLLFTLILTTAAGIYPGIHAGRLNPAEAMRKSL